MNVTCGSCSAVYRVDPAKVPAGGVRARCSVCPGIMAIGDPRRASTDQPLAPPAPDFSALQGASPLSAPSPKPAQTVIPEPVAAPVAPMFAPPPPTMGPIESRTQQASIQTTVPWSTIRPLVPPAIRPPARPAPPPSTRPLGAAPSPPVTPPPQASPPSATTEPAPTAPPVPAAKPRPVNPFLSQDPEVKARRLARALISDLVVYHPAKRRDGLRDGSLKLLFEEEIRKSWEEFTEQVGVELASRTTYFTEALNEILADGQSVF